MRRKSVPPLEFPFDVNLAALWRGVESATNGKGGGKYAAKLSVA
jgi:hypothetical protein